MAGVVNELIEVLSNQKECYEGLYTLSTYKAKAIVEKDIDFLKEVIEREEQFVGRVSLLERKRDSLFKDIAMLTGLDYKHLTVTKLVDKMGHQLDVSKELISLRESLIIEIEKVRKHNEHVKELIEQSLEFVEFTLNAIQTTRLSGIEVNYSRAGYQNDVEVKRLFDTQR
ncbi:MAG: hypothetical protein ATN35_00225 [Epulopiscium sp. Nele67-Bin004]|nr:MAG: hypothetical protein ATN35_00225 [Epulopiscium sp. Nele67-Bin004]